MAAICSAASSFTRHRVVADSTCQRGCAGWRTGGAEFNGALLSLALRCSSHDALSLVLWGKSPLGAFISGCRAARPALRSAQHNGVHPPALEYPADPCSICTHFSFRGSTLIAASGTFANGRSYPASLYDGP